MAFGLWMALKGGSITRWRVTGSVRAPPRARCWWLKSPAGRLPGCLFWGRRGGFSLILRREGCLRRSLPPHAARRAVARKDGDGAAALPSVASLRRWYAESESASVFGAEARANRGVALTPGVRTTSHELPAWLPLLLAAWQQPQNPSLSAALSALARQGVTPMPTLAQARYWLNQRMGTLARESGRKTGNALLALQPYFKRDQSEIPPNLIWAADGHCFDAEMQHPDTGSAIKPEITLIKCVGTLRIVAFSLSLAESQFAILDAIHAAAQREGETPAIFFTDNGAYRGKLLTDDSTLGVFARFGISHHTSIPCRPQGHGIIEAAHKILIRAAKTFESYMGADMDRDAMQRFHRISRKELRLLKKGTPDGRVVAGAARARLPDMDEVTAAIAREIDAYNNHPHRGLPKIRAEDGARRHLTPNECHALWQQKGYEHAPVTPFDLADMARPRVQRRISRGTVNLFGNVYASRELAEFHGAQAQVGFCTGDASRVWVYTHPEGKFICVAGFEENKQAFMAQTALDAAKAKRLAAQAKRLQAHADENTAQRWAVTALERASAKDDDVIEALYLRQQQQQEEEAASAAESVDDGLCDVIEMLERRWG
ncbi:hypothetical protein FACS1894185_3010 [Betaproteobacteria bacterium]|nr:hypothetical protein FACS1894185_3010 [Betaproteobacteria bacterium]